MEKDFTAEELEQMLSERRKKDAEAREKRKKAYEERRDKKVQIMVMQALEFQNSLKEWKDELHAIFEEQLKQLNEYGSVPGNSKGGFSLVHSSGDFKAARVRATKPTWDERAQKAVTLISEFLRDVVKKRHEDLFDILMDFIQKNDKGELEYSKVMNLFKHMHKWNDPRWIEGLNLIRESYSVHLKGYAYEFFVKDPEGKWDRIDINFTQL